MHFKKTEFGFEWGSAVVQRASSDEEKGWVDISVISPKDRVEIYVTKSGKIRVFDKDWREYKKR